MAAWGQEEKSCGNVEGKAGGVRHRRGGMKQWEGRTKPRTYSNNGAKEGGVMGQGTNGDLSQCMLWWENMSRGSHG